MNYSEMLEEYRIYEDPWTGAWSGVVYSSEDLQAVTNLLNIMGFTFDMDGDNYDEGMLISTTGRNEHDN